MTGVGQQERSDREIRVFVSFATPDRQFVRRLLARLAATGLDVWDYSDEEQELPVGRALLPSLIERIDMADVCIPVISSHAFASWACREEVRHAFSRWTENRLRLFPIASAVLSCSPWPDPYCAIQSMLYQQVDFQSGRALEAALIRLCDDLERPYRPPYIGDPRLPFMNKFRDELEQVTTVRLGREGRENAIYRRLMEAQQDFEECVKWGDYKVALERITFILLTCEYEFPKSRLYYPYITKAVCQIATGQVHQALRTIKPLLGHPDKDENLYGLLGYIWNHEGEYQLALRSYQIALQCAPDDAALRAHVLLHRMLLNIPIEDADLFSVDDSPNRTLHDCQRLKAVRALALAKLGRLEEAKRTILELLVEADPEDIEHNQIIHFAELFAQHGQPRLAEKLLTLSERLFGEQAGFVEYRARRFLQLGDAERALSYYQRLVTWHPHSGRYRIEEAKMYWLLGRTQEAQALCTEVLKDGRLPRNASDFYYTGLANWLLGAVDRAEYDFSRSGYPPLTHYGTVLAHLSKLIHVSQSSLNAIPPLD
jgi:tetratricopeptide (TPR) repeat protein